MFEAPSLSHSDSLIVVNELGMFRSFEIKKIINPFTSQVSGSSVAK